jgi:hypothetical protein
MGKAQGKKVDPAAVAARTIEAQLSFGQIKPSEATWLARPGSYQGEGGGYHGPHKPPVSTGEGKETLA